MIPARVWFGKIMPVLHHVTILVWRSHDQKSVFYELVNILERIRNVSSLIGFVLIFIRIAVIYLHFVWTLSLKLNFVSGTFRSKPVTQLNWMTFIRKMTKNAFNNQIIRYTNEFRYILWCSHSTLPIAVLFHVNNSLNRRFGWFHWIFHCGCLTWSIAFLLTSFWVDFYLVESLLKSGRMLNRVKHCEDQDHFQFAFTECPFFNTSAM